MANQEMAAFITTNGDTYEDLNDRREEEIRRVHAARERFYRAQHYFEEQKEALDKAESRLANLNCRLMIFDRQWKEHKRKRALVEASHGE